MIRETNGNFDSCNSCKRLGTSRLHELHESKFPFVSRIEFIRSKLSNFSAHVYGVAVTHIRYHLQRRPYIADTSPGDVTAAAAAPPGSPPGRAVPVCPERENRSRADTAGPPGDELRRANSSAPAPIGMIYELPRDCRHGPARLGEVWIGPGRGKATRGGRCSSVERVSRRPALLAGVRGAVSRQPSVRGLVAALLKLGCLRGRARVSRGLTWHCRLNGTCRHATKDSRYSIGVKSVQRLTSTCVTVMSIPRSCSVQLSQPITIAAAVVRTSFRRSHFHTSLALLC